MFAGKTLLITGGTGSFSNAVLRRFLYSDIKEIRIFSRDEKKQDDMRHTLQNPKVKFYIGDVRNKAHDFALSNYDNEYTHKIFDILKKFNAKLSVQNVKFATVLSCRPPFDTNKLFLLVFCSDERKCFIA